MTRIFVGRAEEQANFRDWVSGRSDRRAALLIGPAGMGKSALLEQYEEICQQHEPEQWYVQRIRLNANESPSAFLDRVLRDTHSLMAGRLIRSGPNDKRLLKGLLKSVPGMGDILAALVGDEKRPGWQRFLDYAYALSKTLKKKNERFVLLVDPDPTVAEEQAVEWLSIAAKDGLPEEVRIVIAQRPDDAIVTNGDSKLRFHQLAGKKVLGELDLDSVIAWYETVLRQDDFKEQINTWTAKALRDLPKAAQKHYGGYPFAHDAVVRLLKMEPVEDPIARIKYWPQDLTGLMDMLFESLAGLGEHHLRASLVLQIFTIPTPKEVWAQAAGLEVEKLTSMLASPKYGHFFPLVETNWGDSHFPYHALFKERLGKELDSIPERRKELADLAWEAIRPGLDKELLRTSKPREFELWVGVIIAIYQGVDSHIFEVVNRVFNKKLQLGLLDSAISDIQIMHRFYGYQESVCATCDVNLGIVMQRRGDLDGAEAMYRKSLEFNKELGRHDRMVNIYCHLGNVMQTRGDFYGAEVKYRKSLEIAEKLGMHKDIAHTYCSLGNLMQTRGDLDGAEVIIQKSIEIAEKLGLLDVIAHNYCNLGNVILSRGDLVGAETEYRKSLKIVEKLGLLEAMASCYGNLGIVMEQRGDLAGAEAMYKKSLKTEEKQGRIEGMASDYGNLGNVLGMRGDWDGAGEMYRKAIELFANIGMPHMVEQTQRNLDRLAEARTAAKSELVP